MKVLTTMSGRGSVLKFRLTRRVRASFGEQRMRIGTALADEKSMGSRLTITWVTTLMDLTILWCPFFSHRSRNSSRILFRIKKSLYEC